MSTSANRSDFLLVLGHVEQRHNFSGKDSVGSDERDYRGQEKDALTRNTLGEV
ncbi:hypothetical protein ACNKHM_20195 [Shigella sonnei]